MMAASAQYPPQHLHLAWPESYALNTRAPCITSSPWRPSPPTFRRSCTTELIRGGGNFWHVKELLGHAHLDTLQRSAKLTLTTGRKRTRNATRANARVETLFPTPMFPSMTIEQIVEETRLWPEDTIAELIDHITLAKHGGLAPERESAWAEVAARRSAELDSGKENLVPGHEVSARIRRIVGR